MLNGLHWRRLATIIAYMLAGILIGAWFSRSEDSSEEYLLGGRKMVWWAVGWPAWFTITIGGGAGEAWFDDLMLEVK